MIKFYSNQRARKLLQCLLVILLVIPLMGSLVRVGEGAPATWDISDFVVSGNKIVGLSAAGTSKLQVDPIMIIPSIPGVDTIDSGFSGQHITSLTINAGYTMISPHVFQGCGVSSLTLPSTLTNIGEYAFASNSLVSLDLSVTSLTTVEASAFRDNSLGSVVLGSDVIQIGPAAFLGNQISSIDLSAVKTIEDSAFMSNALTAVDLSSVASLAQNAFDSNNRVVKVSTGNTSVVSHFSLGSGYVVNPVAITISYLDQSGNSIKSNTVIGQDFTADGLYPSGVEVTLSAPAINGYRIVGDEQKTVVAAAGLIVSFTYESCSATPSITANNKLFTTGATIDTAALLLGVSATSGVDGSTITDISVTPSSIDTVAPGVYSVTYVATDSYGNVGAKTVVVTVQLDVLEQYIGGGWQYKDFKYLGSTVAGLEDHTGRKKYREGNTDLVLPGFNPYTGEAITAVMNASLGGFNFLGEEFTSIDFSQTKELVSIGGGAFGNSRLTSLDLSGCPNLKTIDDGAFSSSRLTSLDLSGCPNLKTIGDGAFGNSQLTSLDLSGCLSLQIIGGFAFHSAQLTSLDLSGCSNLQTIGSRAFGYSKLISLDLSGCSNLQTIESGAFSDSQLTTLDLSGCLNLQTIEGGAFSSSRLTSLDLSSCSNLRKIGDYAFQSAQLTSLDLSGCSNLQEVMYGAFYRSPLTSLDLSGCLVLQTIDNSAFQSAQLTSLDLSACSDLQKIGNYAFQSAPLTSLDLSYYPNLQTIGESAFASAQLTSLDLSACPDLRIIGSRAFASAQLTSLDLSACPDLRIIGSRAFASAQLTSLDLSACPDLQTIGNEAFFFSQLTSLNFSGCSVLQTIGDSAFYYSQLTSLDFSGCSSLEVIEHSAFLESPLTSLNLSSCDSLQTIGTSAFREARLTSLDLARCLNFQSIGENAFHNSQLENIVIGKISDTNRGTSNIYDYAHSRDIVITRHNPNLPIYILDTSGQTITNDSGYIVNPVKVTVNYVDSDNNVIRPGSTSWLSAPLINHEFAAPSIFGYKPVDGTSPAVLNIPASGIAAPINHEVTFVYEEVDRAYYADYAWFNLSQTTKKDFDLIGNTLLTTVRFSASSLSGVSSKNTAIHLYYDSSRIDPNSITVTNSVGNSYTTDTSTPGIIKLTINADSKTGVVDFEPTITWKLFPGVTEEYKEFPIVAELINTEGIAVVQANTVSLSGYYLTPRITKLANGSSANSLAYTGLIGSDGRFVGTPSITYEPNVSNLQRNVESITYTDTLPTYAAYAEDGSTVTKTAAFDLGKNPGWTDNGDGTVSCTFTGLNTTSVPVPKLILDFPDIQPNTSIYNSINFSATPYGMYELERIFSGSASISNTVSGEIVPSGTIFEKRVVGTKLESGNTFFDTQSGKSQQFQWALTVYASSLETGQYFSDVVLRDDSLDDRMRYTKVDLGPYIDANIRAFGVEGDLLFEATKQNGTVSFPQAIRDTIASVIISDSMLTIKQGSYAQLHIYSELRNPDSISYEQCMAENRVNFRNIGHLDAATIFNEAGEEVGSALQGDYPAAVYIRNYDLGIGVSKSVSGNKATYMVGDSVSYNLGLNFYSNNSPISASGAEGKLTNAVIYDVLPEHITPEAFIPDPLLVASAVNLKYVLIGDGFTDNTGIKHDVIKITADSLDLSGISKIGRVDARVSTMASNNTFTNYVYLDYAQNPKLKKVGAITENTDNPFGEEGILSGSAQITVIATNEFIAQKQIRAKNGDGSWAPWRTDGIRTIAGAAFQYKLLLLNNSLVHRSGFVVTDALPYCGDIGMVASTNGEREARKSLFEDTLVSVEALAGYTVEYLVSTTPIDYAGDTADAYYDNASWTTVLPLDTSYVRAFRVNAPTGENLLPGESIEIIINMRASTRSEDVDKRAYNTFARKDAMQDTYIESNSVYNEIYKPAQITVTKYANGTWNKLIGATFGLFDASGNLVQTKTTTTFENPVVFTGIERGNYTIEELVAPMGYDLAAPVPVLASDFSDSNGMASVYTCSKTVYDALSPVYGSLNIKKLDADHNPLADVQFRVTQVASPYTSYTKTTDATGKLIFSNLPVGNYTIEEIATPGKIQRISKFTVAVGETQNTADSLPSQVTLEGDKITLEIINNKAAIKLYKLGILDPSKAFLNEAELNINDGLPLSGAVFELYKAGSSIPEVTNLTTSLKGIVDITNLETGQLYFVREVIAPQGYEKSDDVYFVVTTAGKLIAEDGTPFSSTNLIVKDIPTPESATLNVVKKDAQSEAPIKGAIFKLMRQNEVDGSYITVYDDLETDANGEISVSSIVFGTYRLSEVKAPDGYLPTGQTKTFVVNKGSNTSQSFSYTIKDVSTKPTIAKGEYVGTFNMAEPFEVAALDAACMHVKSMGKSPQKMHVENNHVILLAGLGGAIYEVNEYVGDTTEGTPTATFSITSKADGSFDLPPGFVFKEENTYTFTETDAPSGYQLNSTIYVYQPAKETASIEANGGKWIALEDKTSTHKIVISKYGSDTRSALENATFELLHPDGTPVKDKSGTPRSLTSNSAGLIEIEDVAVGTYYLHEVSAPANYTTIGGYWKITFEGEQAASAEEDIYTDVISANPENTINATIQTDGNAYIVVYNDSENDPYTLTVEKLVSGIENPLDVFTFTVSLGVFGTLPYSGPYMLYANSSDMVGTPKFTTNGVITLSHGQRAKISGFAEGDAYQVEESTDFGAQAYTVTVSGKGGVHESSVYRGEVEGREKVVFTNTYEEIDTAAITVSKTVSALGDHNKEFTFTLSTQDGTVGPFTWTRSDEVTGTVTANDLMSTFTLSHGQSVVIEDLPLGTNYSIAEETTQGYRAVVPSMSGEVQVEGLTFAFVNIHKPQEEIKYPPGEETSTPTPSTNPTQTPQPPAKDTTIAQNSSRGDKGPKTGEVVSGVLLAAVLLFSGFLSSYLLSGRRRKKPLNK